MADNVETMPMPTTVGKPSPLTTAEARLEHGRLVSLINSMADGVIAADENGKVIITNGAALSILDTNASIIGRSLWEIMPILDATDQPVDLRAVIQRARSPVSSRDWKLTYKDGERINLYVSIAPVRLSYGQTGAGGHVLLLRDITREKSLEEERDEFISVVSHELRTPVAIAEGNISNAALLFEKSGLKHLAIQKALKEAHNQIAFLAGLINDLAALSRAERGRVDNGVENINVHDFINELVESYRSQAEISNLSLRTEIDPNLELLRSNRLYVREVLQNFVTNSLKYTDQGHITIGAKRVPRGVEFYVADTGIGISRSDKRKVFQKFFRSEDYRTRTSGGTGLGLYIAKKLAALLGGEISFESELGRGSTFRLIVPSRKA